MIFLTSGSVSAVTWIGIGTGTHDDDLLEENPKEEDGEFQPHVGWMADVLATKSLIFAQFVSRCVLKLSVFKMVQL